MKKIVIYIDGSNFYFSVKKKFNCKVDIEKFCKKLASDEDLVKINYYIAPVEQKKNPEMYAQQQSFFYKLKEINNFNIIFGRLEKRRRDGEIYFVEKATDVNLALDIALDAQAGEYDVAYLVSNDGDFSGAVRASVERFGKEVVYVAIGNNRTISHHLKRVSHKTFRVEQDFIGEVVL